MVGPIGGRGEEFRLGHRRPMLDHRRGSRRSRGIGPGTLVPYLPGIDGLRALSVAAVILYHAGVSWLPGGFFGVEVFFVISGFLITSLLRGEQAEAGRVSLVGFWGRRARRLLPGAWFLMLSVFVLVVSLLPEELPSLRSDLGAGLSYVTNWWLVIEEKSYFAQAGRPSLLTHLWSLAIEEQFYLLWPPVFAYELSRWRPRLAAAFLCGLSLLSCAWAALLFDPDVDPSRLYYGSDTRASGLLLGCALAFLVRPNMIPGSTAQLRLLDGLGLLALIALGCACMFVSEYNEWLYRGFFVIVGLATVVVITPASMADRTWVSRLLGVPLLAAIGRRSYSLYLWHWPVLMLTRPGIDVSATGSGWLLVRLALVAALAELSYRWVEMPLRRAASRTLTRTRVPRPVPQLARPAAATFFIAALVAVLGVVAPSAFRRAPALDGYGQLETSANASLAGHLPASLAAVGGMAPAGATDSSGPNPPAGPALAALMGHPLSAEMPEAPPTAEQWTGLPQDFADRRRKPTRVLAFGDSVMLGARHRLRMRGVRVVVDAVSGRQVSQSLKRLLERRRTGGLAPVVVVHLGNNGTFREQQFDRMMYLLSPANTVIFVNAKVPRRWQAPNNEVIAAGVKRHPNAVLVDWERYSRDQVEWFARDGYHLARPGGLAYAELVRSYFLYPSEAESTLADREPVRRTPARARAVVVSKLAAAPSAVAAVPAASPEPPRVALSPDPAQRVSAEAAPSGTSSDIAAVAMKVPVATGLRERAASGAPTIARPAARFVVRAVPPDVGGR